MAGRKAPAGRRSAGRTRKAGAVSVFDSESESQPCKGIDSSSPSDYSTRPTSGVPTPSGMEPSKTKATIEIPLLRRSTRTLDDELALNTTSRGNMDGDDSDEEYTKPRRRSARVIGGAGNLADADLSLKPKPIFSMDDSEGDYDDGFSAKKKRRSTRMARGGAFRRNEMSLNPSGKRKSGMLSDEDDASDYDPSQDRDFQLALRLQAEEDAGRFESITVGGGPKSKSAASSFSSSGYPRPKKRLRGHSASSMAQQHKAPGFVKASALAVVATESEAEGLGNEGLDDELSDQLDSDELMEFPTSNSDLDSDDSNISRRVAAANLNRRGFRMKESIASRNKKRVTLEKHHPKLLSMWADLQTKKPLRPPPAQQPANINRQMKEFQLAGLSWMQAVEATDYKGGLLGDEMGLGKTIQAVSLIMSDFPANKPSLVLVPPVALMQWVNEIESYTDGTLKTFVFHGTNTQTKKIKAAELKNYDVILMSYQSLESMYRRETTGHKKKAKNSEFEVEIVTKKSLIHQIHFHRVILDEAHEIKTRTTGRAKACFALKADHRWCLSGTPLQNRIGELFSLVRFLEIKPFASYFCRACPCENLEWNMDENKFCKECEHASTSHVSIFNQELLLPIQKFGNVGLGAEAFRKLRLLTDHLMLRRLKKDHTDSMELPVKELTVSRQFFGEVENDFANSIMTNTKRNFETYVAQGVMLNNYANIFGLIMQMRQVADHPDLLLKKNAEGGQNIIECSICESPAEDPVASKCHHHFCRTCVRGYLDSLQEPECPRCHVGLSIDLDQPEIEQDQMLLKKASIINRIKMENWTSSSKIELLVHELFKLRSPSATHKSIIFSQFTSMLQLIEWRLRHAGFTTVMLDGSMTPAQRNASIKHFMNNVDVEVFLVSLKAGGVALNLTEASRVFLVEPWWNPAVEWQSADRCHRIGQSRPCIITNLVIEDSVESRMVLLQEKKARMITSTIDKNDKAMESLTPQDMQFLFRGT